MKNFDIGFLGIGLALFVLASYPAGLKAQSIQAGPDLEIPGFQMWQGTPGSSAYDPYVIYKSYDYRIDPPTREGLIDARITVQADGQVTDVEVVGGFYSEQFLEDALNGIRGSKFKPPMQGDEAIVWPHMDIRIIQRGPFVPAVNDEVQSASRRIEALISDRDFGAAETDIKNVLEDRVQFLSEMALLQMQLATVYTETGRTHDALLANRLSTSRGELLVAIVPPNTRISRTRNAYSEHFLAPELFFLALHKHVLAALALNQTGEAVEVFQLLQAEAELQRETGQIEGVKQLMSQLAEALASDQPIVSPVRLVEGTWIFTMSSRRVFGVTGLAGKVDYIDVNCKDSRKRRMPFTNDFEFRIPDSWGQCNLEFRGDDGSTFNLFEFLN